MGGTTRETNFLNLEPVCATNYVADFAELRSRRMWDSCAVAHPIIAEGLRDIGCDRGLTLTQWIVVVSVALH